MRYLLLVCSPIPLLTKTKILTTPPKKKCMYLSVGVTLQHFLIDAAFWLCTILRKLQMRKSFMLKHWIFRSQMDFMSRPYSWPLIMEGYRWLR